MKDFSLTNNLRNFFPVKVFLLIIVIWLVLAALNFLSLQYWKFTGADLFFPFSVLYPSSFLITGFVFAAIFFLFGSFIYLKSDNISVGAVLLSCLLLVFLGNMAQGSLDIAFEQPLYLKGRQYYNDAINITDASVWLRTFTDYQDQFQMHTRTHPPFAVLLHYWFLQIFNGNILGVAVSFFLISSLFFGLLNQILKNFRFGLHRRKELLLFSAIVPAVNIYLLVSIDGIILMTSTLMLLGLSRIYAKKTWDFLSFLIIFLALMLTNMLSFSGLFLFAFLGLYSLFFIHTKRYDYLILTVAVFAVYLLSFLIFYYIFGYNHLQAFLHASESENPGGFMLFQKPYIYFWTRMQAVGEILMFLSLGFCAVLFGGKRYRNQLFSNTVLTRIFISGVTALGLMFLSGTYGTGETARACLFIVPLFLLLLKDLKRETMFILYFLCLLQTFGMQTIGNFYW